MSDLAVVQHEIVAAGVNWEVLADYIPEDFAQAAGEQAVWAITNPYDFEAKRQVNGSNSAGLLGVIVDTREDTDFGDSMLDSPIAERELPDLTALARRLKGESERVNQHRGIINYYTPKIGRREGGFIGMHRDRQPEETYAVALLGIARATIIDPATRIKYEFDIEPGMALKFDNPEDVSMRPAHNVQNIRRKVPRVSYSA